MRFEVRESARHARGVVFAAHRDELEAIARYLPDVEKVELRSRSKGARGLEEQVHWWTGSPSALPVFVRPMVPPHLLQWSQRTTWDPATHTASWTIEVPGLGPAVVAGGTNTYVDEGSTCGIGIVGDFAFHPERVPQLAGIPAAAVPMVERMVVKLIVPMIERTGAAVARYLDERR
ncbi:MAG: hypothetical protein ABMB14_17155 [Myxococcota bacterium]